jgi:DNA-binding MurR/RpiR family transcriptional regulator
LKPPDLFHGKKTVKNILKKIRAKYKELSPSEKKVADYIIGNYQTVAFLSCQELGKLASASDTTVIRLSNKLGYKGFLQLKKELQEVVQEKISPSEKLSKTAKLVSTKDFIAEAYELELTSLEKTYRMLDSDEVMRIIGKIRSARRIFAMGLGLSAATIRYLCNRLRRISKDVVEINSSAYSLVEKISQLSKDDLLIAFDFPRYSTDVFKTIRYAKEDIGATTVLITDNLVNPSLEYSDEYIFACNDALGFTNSTISSDFVASILTVGVALGEKESSLSQLGKNEQFAKILGHSN